MRRELGEDDHANGLLINRALEARAVGDYERATALLEESLARHRSQQNRESRMHVGLGISLSSLALILNEQGQFARAKALQEECLALHRDLGDRDGVAWALLGLSDIARNQGDAGATRAQSEEALALFRALGRGPGTGFALNNVALAALLDGDLDRAAHYAEEGVSLFRGLDHRAGQAEVLITLGRIRRAQGDMYAARNLLTEALDLGMQEGPRLFVVGALEALAVEVVGEGHARDAVLLLGAVDAFRRTMGAPTRPADRPEVDQALESAGTLLGPDAFSVAWSAGQTLSLEQAIDRFRARRQPLPPVTRDDNSKSF